MEGGQSGRAVNQLSNLQNMAAGDFTASNIAAIKLNLQNAWGNSQLSREMAPNVDAARAVIQNQSSNNVVQLVTDSSKDYDVNVYWIDPCTAATQACSSACDFTPAQLESKSQAYTLTLCREAEFAVSEDVEKSNYITTDQQITTGFQMKMRDIEEWVNTQVMLKINSFAGPNFYPTPWTYDAADTTTEVPTADWNAQMMANLVVQANRNKLTNAPYLLNDGSLAVDFLNRQWDSGNLDGKGDAARISALPIYYDWQAFAAAGLTDNMFMIDRSAIAYANKTDNPDTARYVQGDVNMWIYTMKSNYLPNTKFDVFHRLTCAWNATKNREYFVHAFKIRFKGDFLLNPKGCSQTVNGVTGQTTGVLSYTKV
jgi:hypothetical protein